MCGAEMCLSQPTSPHLLGDADTGNRKQRRAHLPMAVEEELWMRARGAHHANRNKVPIQTISFFERSIGGWDSPPRISACLAKAGR